MVDAWRQPILMGGAPYDYYLLSFLRQPALANCPLRLDMIFTFRLSTALLMHTSPVTMSLTVYEILLIILRQVNRHQSTHERDSPCLVSVLFWQPREPLPTKTHPPGYKRSGQCFISQPCHLFLLLDFRQGVCLDFSS